MDQEEDISEKIQEILEQTRIYENELGKTSKMLAQIQNENLELKENLGKNMQSKSEHSTYFDQVLAGKDQDLKKRTGEIKELEKAQKEYERKIQDLNVEYRELHNCFSSLQEEKKMLEEENEFLNN